MIGRKMPIAPQTMETQPEAISTPRRKALLTWFLLGSILFGIMHYPLMRVITPRDLRTKTSNRRI